MSSKPFPLRAHEVHCCRDVTGFREMPIRSPSAIMFKSCASEISPTGRAPNLSVAKHRDAVSDWRLATVRDVDHRRSGLTTPRMRSNSISVDLGQRRSGLVEHENSWPSRGPWRSPGGASEQPSGVGPCAADRNPTRSSISSAAICADLPATGPATRLEDFQARKGHQDSRVLEGNGDSMMTQPLETS
jgi:hypothetical protein